MHGKKIVIYGNAQRMRDIQYVFEDLQISCCTQKVEDIIDYVLNQGFFALLCEDDNRHMIERFEQQGIAKKDNYCLDDELIETLNYSLKEHCENKQIVVWGTGYQCEQFLKTVNERNLDVPITAFVDSDSAKWGKKYNGLPVVAPARITAEEHFVIVAAGYENYVSIEKQLHNMGFRKDGYIYFRIVVDDIAAYFKRTYRCRDYYDAACKVKDASVRIDANGNVCSCCMAYNSVYGNLFENTFEEVWNSKRAAISRLALENRTYCFCDKERCPYLCGIQKQIRTENKNVKEYEKSVDRYPDSIAPEIDRSCNLYCVSCRNQIYVENNSYRDCYTDMVLDKIVHLPVRVIINTVGEAFASKNCLRIIHDERTVRRKQLSIYSNGTLLSPAVMDDLLQKYETLEIAISVDAATQETYEKIRRNGRFDVLASNLSYISRLKKQGRITWFQLNYVLETENIGEMEQFILWGEQLGVDRIEINKIEQWGTFTDERYQEVSILRNGEIKKELRPYFKKELLELKWVDFFNLSNYLGVEQKRNHMM